MKNKTKIKKLLLPWLDWNDNDKIDWYEWLIPLLVILLIEIVADTIANFIYWSVTGGM